MTNPLLIWGIALGVPTAAIGLLLLERGIDIRRPGRIESFVGGLLLGVGVGLTWLSVGVVL